MSNFWKIFIIAVIVVSISIAAYAALLLYITWPISELSISNSGVFGDSFGFLTSLFTGLGFAGLIATVLIQNEQIKIAREDIKSTREEQRLQKLDESFYRILHLYKDNLKELSVRLSDDGQRVYGVDGIKHLLEKFSRAWKKSDHKIYPDSDDHQIEFIYSLVNVIQSVFSWQTRYLETITSILVLIDSECKTIEEKSFYWNALGAQLTSYELKYLFYQAFVSPRYHPLNSLLSNSSIFKVRLAAVDIPEAHKKAFKRLWNVEIPTGYNLHRMPLTKEEVKVARKLSKKRREETVKSIKALSVISIAPNDQNSA